MTAKQSRQTVWSLAAAVMIIITARRWWIVRNRAAHSSPQTERLVVPLPATTPTTVDAEQIEIVTPEDDQEDDHVELLTRKVSKDRRIKFHGQRYGPLPEHLIGQQVSVRQVGQELQISSDGEVIATFNIGNES